MNWNVIYRIHTNLQYLTLILFIFMNYSGNEDEVLYTDWLQFI